MHFSGKITNSFFTFLNRYELDTSQFFEMTPLEIDFIRDPYSWLSAEQVELLLQNIQSAYKQRFIDKDLVVTIGHNAPHLKSWGALDDSLNFFDSPQAVYGKIDRFLSFFVSELAIYNKENNRDFFSFKTDFNEKEYPVVKDYLKSVLEILPVFLGQDQTEAEWKGDEVKIYYLKERTLTLPLKGIQEKSEMQGSLTSSSISHLKAREIIDSRGSPTLEVDVQCENGLLSRGIVPSGASTGRFEARELRDGDPKYFFSKGLKKACRNVEKLSSLLEGKNIQDQSGIDKILIEKDNSSLKENLGANTLLGISLACLRGAAKSAKKPLYEYAALNRQNVFFLPVPLINIINGGLHGSNKLDIQEFMIVPFGFDSFKEALRASCEVFYELKKQLKSKGFSVAVGDEGGFTPDFSSSGQAFDFILSSIEKCSYTGKIALALDCASSEFYNKGTYHFEGKKRNQDQMIAIYEKWSKQYPIVSIEDALSEEDWEGWKQMTDCLGKSIQLVGDDLFVTQKDRVQRGIQKGAANALLVKYNQVGTITETKSAVLTAQSAGLACVLSHRSGDTEDTSIADLSVAWGTEQIKTGSVCRGERTAKYNRLIRIEEELGKRALFRGKKAFKNLKRDF